VLLTLTAVALAGPPSEDLARLMSQEAWSGAMVCSPAGELYDVILMGAQVLEAADQVHRPDELAMLRQLLAGDASSPLVPAGTVEVGFTEGDEGPRHLVLPFQGTADDLAALVLPGSELLTVADDGRLWMDELPLDVVDGTLRVARSGAGGGDYPWSLLDGLGGETGCVMAMDLRALGPAAPQQLEAAAVYLALDNEALFEVRLQGGPVPELPAPLIPAPAVFAGSSTLAPDVTVLVATDGLPALAAMAQSAPAAAATELLAVVEALQGRATLPPGLTLAFFGQAEARRLVAVVPVAGSNGKPLKRRRLRAVVEAGLDGWEGEWAVEGDDGYRLLSPQGTASWLRLGEGQVVFGDLAEVVIEAHTGAGEPWGDPQAEALSQAWPLVVVPGQMPQLPAALPLAMGVQVHPDHLEIGVDTLGDKGNDYLVGMLVGIAVPNFVEMRSRAWRATLETELNAVVTAQIGHHAVHASFVQVPAAPRPVDALDARQVAWQADPAWDVLAFAPAAETTRGTYSVELTELGFMAHGFMDADGDGVPAHMVVTWTPEGPTRPVLITPDSVY